MPNPLISVIIPAYNAAKYLPQALDSILNQSCQDFELIVVDDGSTDDTSVILDDYKKRDHRIYSICQDNSGVSSARNTGIAHARGEYIAFMDSDDIADHRRLDDQVSYLRENNLDICGSAVQLFGDIKKESVKKFPEDDSTIKFNLFFFGRAVSLGTALIKADLCEDNLFSIGMSWAEDYEFWTRLVATHPGQLRFGNINKPLLKYRVHTSQATKFLSSENRLAVTGAVYHALIKTGFSVTTNDILLHYDVIKSGKKVSKSEYLDYLNFLDRLYLWLSDRLDEAGHFNRFIRTASLKHHHLGFFELFPILKKRNFFKNRTDWFVFFYQFSICKVKSLILRRD